MGLIEDLADSLDANLSLFTIFKIDVLSAEDNALTIRRYQSSQSTRFIDNSRDDLIGIQILVKNTDQRLAIDSIEKIRDYLATLEGLQSSDGSYEFIGIDIYIQPLLVEKTDHGAYLYQAMFTAKIYRQNQKD